MDFITAVFAIAGIIIFVGFIGEWIFEKTNIPDVLWLMILGIIVGNIFHASENEILLTLSPLFTTFALVFILFEGVLNVDMKKLAVGVIEGSSMAFLSFIITMFATAIAMLLVGWGFWEGMLLGAILSDSSQAVIVPLLKKIHAKAQTGLILTFESAISDVFVIVGGLSVINIIMMQSFSLPMVMQKIIYSFVLAIAAGIITGNIWIKILPIMDKLSKSYLTTIAALLLLYSVVESFEANGALACLAFGIVVGNSKKIYSYLKKDTQYSMSTSAKFFYSEISFFLKTFFFVYLGLLINLKNLHLMLIGVLLAILLFLVRPISVSIANRKMRLDDKERTYLEIMNSKGLSAAVLAQLPAQFGIPHGDEFSTIVLAAIITSVLLTIFTVFLTERGMFRGVRHAFDLRRIKFIREKLHLQAKTSR